MASLDKVNIGSLTVEHSNVNIEKKNEFQFAVSTSHTFVQTCNIKMDYCNGYPEMDALD
jgi:hypothetical protein